MSRWSSSALQEREGVFSFLVSLGTTDPARGSRLSPSTDSPRRIAERRAVRLARRKQAQRLLAGLPLEDTSLAAAPSAKVSTVQALAAATSRFREHRAARHDAIRRDTEREIVQTLRAAGNAHAEETRAELVEYARALDRRRDWHASRARGQRDRFERVAACGEGKARATCHACGDEHELPVRCDVWRVCISCRARAAIERRARFGRGRAKALRIAHRTGRLSRFRRGRWTEKHMTLTVPHVVGATERATVRLRIDLGFAAWRLFTIALRKHWLTQAVAAYVAGGINKRDAVARAHADRARSPQRFYRFFEWTPGHDGCGHPHFHVWMLCGWIDHGWIARTWGACLRRAGCCFEGDPIVDVRQIRTRPGEWMRELVKMRDAVKLSRLELAGRGGEDLVEYADGWTIVDASNGGRVSDEVLGALYEALESRRVSQASLGLLDGRELAVCARCGERGTLVVRLLPAVVFAWPAANANARPPTERGPPCAEVSLPVRA
jgi:hypothetical protein